MNRARIERAAVGGGLLVVALAVAVGLNSSAYEQPNIHHHSPRCYEGGTGSELPPDVCQEIVGAARSSPETLPSSATAAAESSSAPPEPTAADRSPEPQTRPVASSPELRTFTFADAGIALDAPETWHAWESEGFLAEITVTGPGASIAIRLPVEETGKMWFIRPTGIARTIAVDSLRDLVAALTDEYQAGTALRPSMIRTTQTPISLDGGEAALVVVGPSPHLALGPAPETYVAAVHDGKPILLRVMGTRDAVDTFLGIVATFRYLD